ncbi:VCBS repeat-containing protein [Agriterribacter sp.]|uniref:FG-GAP repeat domain-containing protein n=1 Tax=Agriterribacter sp. TaxID=2821509 RepID=UPI002CA23F43|nr:VCBS repeat-containing protein [Agriterribacter sp.]HRO46688.1 VCBS repeat-containing protein [Agriterribacter sp.]HRQ16972.1 VCBS repeat-containing protein [Agriterribacter sp.]
MRQLIPFCISLYLLVSCTAKRQNDKVQFEEPPVSGRSGKELAIAHCSRCHAFVSPELLTKTIWKEDVLPAMGYQMGIYSGGFRPDSLFDPGVSGDIVRNAGIYPESPVLAKADWHKIEQYFMEHAPDTIPPPLRKSAIRMGLQHFKYKEASFSHRPSLTTMVKILPDNRGIAYSDGKSRRNVLTFLTPDLKENYSIPLQSTPVQFDEKANGLYLTTTGNGIFPTDAPGGAIQRWVKNEPQPGYQPGNIIIPNLQRPVCIAYGDLNNDGFEDIVACEFGNQTGQLAWYENNGKGGYNKRALRDKPGAITAIIKDANNDGLPDIYVLMAQGDEGVFLYENQGAGTFKEKRLLSFLPLNGSQYIELADFNKDGFDDILYVCGDNADKTPVLKDYHGIYIFLNDGKSNFTQSYFYQMNGAYKAMVRDYDLDGDLDIAAISFFPDYLRYPEESFIYLKNIGNLKFDDYSFPEAPKGRWVVMDAGDMDGDGDIDLVLGSFVYFLPQGDTTGLGKKWLLTGPSVVVLENTIR